MSVRKSDLERELAAIKAAKAKIDAELPKMYLERWGGPVTINVSEVMGEESLNLELIRIIIEHYTDQEWEVTPAPLRDGAYGQYFNGDLTFS